MALADNLFKLAIRGHVGWYRLMDGRFAGNRILLLTTTGRRTGRSRTNPLMFIEDGDNYLVAGSMGGAPHHPGWFHNLRDNPVVTVQVGSRVETRRARLTEGDERDRLYARFVEMNNRFGEYQEKTDREIPVVVLERDGSP